MAHLWLLLKLRLRLALRRHARASWAFAGVGLLVVVFTVAAFAIARLLSRQHETLGAVASARLFDLTSLAAGTFVALGPLLGFRSNEFMDVSKLFQYPIRPAWVFVATVAGHFASGTTLFFLPILLVPALGVAGSATSAAGMVVATLLYLFVLYEVVQCLTLLLLNVLRSRRWRDGLAILVPVLGMAAYAGLRSLILGGQGPGRLPGIERLLDGIDLDPVAHLLPPLWYSHMVHAGPGAFVRGLVAFGLAAAALGTAGVGLTLRAFHGDIAIRAPEGTVRARRAPLRTFLAGLLPGDAAAVYLKELTILEREPWYRMLFLQQLGLVVLICLGRGLWDEHHDAGEALVWAGIFLVFVESGFLLNTLGLEGRAIQHTAMLPSSCFRILAGKNLAYLQVLAVTNALVVPGLALLSSHFAGRPLPVETTLVLVSAGIVVLPVLIASGNLLSVLLPSPVGQRGRRALGQERTGGEGCFAAVARVLLSTLAMVPAAGVGLLVATPVLFLGQGVGPLYWVGSLPLGAAAAAGIWAGLTVLAARCMRRNMQKILAKLA